MATARVRRFYLSPNGNSIMRSGGLLPPPEGWTELTEEEYRLYRADERAPTGRVPVRLLSDVRGS
ncbi:hypothetical protein [Embleya sp. NPDC001921]